MLEKSSAVSKKNIVFTSCCLIFFFCFVFINAKFAISASAEAEKQVEPVAEKPVAPVVVTLGPEDEFNRGVPRTSVKRFLKAAKDNDYESAAQHLDLRNLPRNMRHLKGSELAQQFKTILDRTIWIDLDLLSDHPKGHENDGLPSFRDLLGQFETEKKTYTLLLQHVPREDGVSIWKISNVTVAKIPELYELAGYGPFGELLSAIIPEMELFGAYLWQWLGLIIIMFLAYLAILPLSLLSVSLINRKEKRPRVTSFVRGPLYFLAWVFIVVALTDLISPTVAMQSILNAFTFRIAAFAWVLIRLFDFYIEYQIQSFPKNNKTGAVVLLRPLTNVVRTLIIIAALLIWLDNIGFKITTIMAGLGVGGIAIALAAQAIFADIIGAIILVVSQPVRVGDFCKFGNTLGTVEEIGVRATRIRTLDNTVVSVPNAEFSKLHLENYALREKVWFHPKISLPYETTKEQIGTIARNIEEMLQNHPEVHDTPIQVYFTEIGDYSHNIDVFSYVATGDWGKYKKIAHELNTAIMDIVEKAGSRLALPSRKMYIEEGKVSE